jgi:hypothetical protein
MEVMALDGKRTPILGRLDNALGHIANGMVVLVAYVRVFVIVHLIKFVAARQTAAKMLVIGTQLCAGEWMLWDRQLQAALQPV